MASPELFGLVLVILMADYTMRMLELVIMAHDQMMVTVASLVSTAIVSVIKLVPCFWLILVWGVSPIV